MKNSVHRLALGSFIALLVALEGCAGLFGGNNRRLTNAEVELISFGSVNGELAPCG